MKYVKSISLFFVYPMCCFLAGLALGKSQIGENETAVEEELLHTPAVIGNAAENVAESLEVEAGSGAALREPVGSTLPGSTTQSEDVLQAGSGAQSGNALQAGKAALSFGPETGLYETSENAVSAGMTQTIQKGYVITLLNDYVVVYHGDGETVFLFTDIKSGELPEDICEKLTEGLRLPDEGTLYDFLENYTS